jgi:DNA polymerase III epsilon subunit-like protein
MYLIFDVSANGKPKSFKASPNDLSNWPRMIHISWIVLGENLKPKKDYNCVIKPDGFTISEEIAGRHDVDMERANNEGDDIKQVLQHFADSMKEVKYLFAHNLDYNENILAAEFKRAGIEHGIFAAERLCLMQEGTFYAKIPKRGGGYKWPSLMELHAAIFKQGYSPANNARADVIAASRCFIALHKVGAFDDLYEDEEV